MYSHSLYWSLEVLVKWFNGMFQLHNCVLYCGVWYLSVSQSPARRMLRKAIKVRYGLILYVM